jgi:hypothetical protein
MENSKITPWIPLIQTCIKYGILFIVFLFLKGWAIKGLEVVTERIGSGSSFRIGANGFELGEAPKMKPSADMLASGDVSLPDPPEAAFLVEQAAPGLKSTEGHIDLFERPIDKRFYLVHAARKVKEGSYELKIALGSHAPEALDEVKSVRYYLHDSFPQPVREISDRNKNFEITLTAWGQFELQAIIQLKENEKEIKLSRFLNF